MAGEKKTYLVNGVIQKYLDSVTYFSPIPIDI